MKKKNTLKDLFKPHLLVLYLIICVGAYLRLQGVFAGTFAYTYDVGRDLLAVRDLVDGQKLSLIGPTTGLPGVFYGPWWYLMLAPFFIIFGGNPVGIAFTVAFVGILLIPLSFLLGRKIRGDTLGLVMALFVGISAELIAISAQIWNPNIAPIFVLFALFLLYKIYTKTDKPWVYFLLGIVLLLTFEIEIIFGLFFSTGVVASILLIRRLRIKLISIAAFAIGALIILSPRILFEVRHGFLMIQSFIKYFAGGAEGDRIAGGFTTILLNRLDMFWTEFSYTIAFGNKIEGLLIFVFAVLGLIFVYKKLNNLEKDFIKTSGIILTVFFLGTLAFAHNIWPHYLIGLPIIYLLVVSIIVSGLGIIFKKNLIIYILLLVWLGGNLPGIIKINSIGNTSWEGNASLYRNQLAVVDYAFKNANGQKFKYVVYTPPVFDYTYRYLFSWLANKYNNPPQTKVNIAYFILEPDLEDPSRLTRWLEDRKNDGEIISTKTFKGGIIVQRRFVK